MPNQAPGADASPSSSPGGAFPPVAAARAGAAALLSGRVDGLHARYRLTLEARRCGGANAAADGPGRAPTPTAAAPGLLRRVGHLLAPRSTSPLAPLRVVHNRLHLPALAPALHGLTLLQLSDLHLSRAEAGAATAPRDLLRAVTARPCDVLVLTGDLLAAAHGPPVTEAGGLRALHALLEAAGAPAFAVLGDEDSLHLVPALEALGICVLLNESAAVEHGTSRFYLAGIDDASWYKADDMDAALQSIPRGAFSILLSHTPEVYQRASAAGFDVMLCGHTHGGQICLPGGRPLLRVANSPRRMCRGNWRFGRLCGYTSAGCGGVPLNLRLNCPREVVFHTLQRTPPPGTDARGARPRARAAGSLRGRGRGR